VAWGKEGILAFIIFMPLYAAVYGRRTPHRVADARILLALRFLATYRLRAPYVANTTFMAYMTQTSYRIDVTWCITRDMRAGFTCVHNVPKRCSAGALCADITVTHHRVGAGLEDARAGLPTSWTHAFLPDHTRH